MSKLITKYTLRILVVNAVARLRTCSHMPKLGTRSVPLRIMRASASNQTARVYCCQTPKNCSRLAYRIDGFSLLEILIACALSLILLTSISHIYLRTKEVYRRQNEFTKLQENIRFALHILKKNVEMAGYAGCAKLGDLYLSNHFKEHSAVNLDFKPENSIFGFTSEHAPNYLQGKIKPGTEGLVIKNADSDITQLTESELKIPATFIRVKQNPATLSNQILLIADCDHADLFQAENIDGSIIRLSNNDKIQYSYQAKDTEISRFTELAFFISDTNRSDIRGKPIYGLFMTTNRGKKEEVLSDIKDMKIHFGVGKDTHEIDRYYATYEIEKQQLWRNVQSVIITLTFTAENIANKKISFYITLKNR
jgi:type IV pilus assembly protein PilW